MAAYLIDGMRLGAEDERLSEALANAYRSRRRPICLCTEGGAEMVVAQLGDHFVLKRMPLTGGRHAADCLSSRDLPPHSPRMATAAVEGSPAGMTSIRLAFAMSQGGTTNGSTRHGTRNGGTPSLEGLSLGGLLAYLWDRAALTQWRPAFAGKRSWPVVRRRLLEASEVTLVGHRPLSERLYIPERFMPHDRAGIDARMSEAFERACAGSGPQRRLMLVIGEVKRIWPSRKGGSVLLKHVPGRFFAVDPETYAAACGRFRPELSLWSSSDHIRMMLIATFSPGERTAEIFELSLMPVSQHWLPARPGPRTRSSASIRTSMVRPPPWVPKSPNRYGGIAVWPST